MSVYAGHEGYEHPKNLKFENNLNDLHVHKTKSIRHLCVEPRRSSVVFHSAEKGYPCILQHEKVVHVV